MPSTKNIVLLAVDDAIVTLGSEFREVGLGLLVTALNPRASSYAWYFLAASIPGLVLAPVYGWASERFGARQTMMVSYAARLLLVLGLWRVTNFWAMLSALLGITTGSGFYSAAQAHYVAVAGDFTGTRNVVMPAQAHYVAVAGDFTGTRNVVMRLRQSTSVMLLLGPLLAGLVLSTTGYRSGFLFSAVAYGVALVTVSRLSSQVKKGQPSSISRRGNWHPDGPAMAMLGLGFLTWQANTLAMAYTFHVLHRHAFGYGLTLSVWGGSGLLASLWLSRIETRPLRWIPPMFLVLGASWMILSRGVPFSVFVLLGGIEGFANWMVQDLASAFILSSASEGQAGRARAKLGAFEEIGSIAGTVTILLIPEHCLVRPMYAVLGIMAMLGAGAWLILQHNLSKKRDEKLKGGQSRSLKED